MGSAPLWLRNGPLHKGKLVAHALAFVPDNEIAPLNPYTILISSSGQSIGSITIAVVETDGQTRPPKIDTRCVSLKRIVHKRANVHVGKTPKCQFHRSLPEMLALRDAHNLIHRVKLRKQILTVEIMQSITDPQTRRELVEAICLAAI